MQLSIVSSLFLFHSFLQVTTPLYCAYFTKNIYNDFFIGRLQASYSRIELIADEIIVNEISDELSIVIFKYHTDCDLRETGEPFGIAGLETQVMIKEEGQWRILHVHYSK